MNFTKRHINASQWNTGSKSIRLLLIHLSVCGAAAVGAFVVWVTGYQFWPCAFFHVTGLYCLTCGATRSVFALLRLELLQSLLWNPLPLLLIGWMAGWIALDIYGILKKKHIRFVWTPHCTIGIIGILLAFCLLRNTGIIPIPS